MADLRTTTQLRGLALPATKGPGGFFESKQPLDVAWGDLLLTLFTIRGARPMRRDFGSVLHELLFDPNVDEQAEVVDHVIREAAADHCPHIQIRGVETTSFDRSLQIRVLFALRTDTSNVQAREVLIPKVHNS